MHLQCGRPPPRVIANVIGLSHTTVAVMLQGRQLTVWKSVEKLLRFLRADVEFGRMLWMRAVTSGDAPGAGLAETNRLLRLVVKRLDALTEAVVALSERDDIDEERR